MNIIFSAPATTTADTLVADLTNGTAKVFKEREDGTTRRVHFLADGTTDREHAEWVAWQREEGRSMREIATELHVSISAVRRTLNDLALTEELEEMAAEDLADLLLGSEEEATPATEPTTDRVEALADKVLAGEMDSEEAIITLLV